MIIVEITELTQTQKEAILVLWNKEYPAKNNYGAIPDFDTYLHNLASQQHYLLTDDDHKIKGWAFTFTRDAEKWFAIIIDQSIHGQGYGTRLLDKIKEQGTTLNGWAIDHDNAIKANGELYIYPIGFYLKNGFKISDTRLETETISAVKIIGER